MIEFCRPTIHHPRHPRAFGLLLAGLAACLLSAGCDRVPALFENKDRARDQAEQKQASGDYQGAINSYEKSLDGTTKTADAHFRMGLIYDEKLSDSLSAVYHFRRYLALQPGGSHARDAKNNLGRLELTLATSLSGGTLISHAEALRLKNENMDLHRQLTARANAVTIVPNLPAPKSSTAADSSIPRSTADGTKSGSRAGEAKLAPGSHNYQIQAGDTLASISRKFYKTRDRAKDIQDANMNTIPNAAKLKPGQTIIIP